MSEIKPVAQVAFELRTNVLKGQWESDKLNDTDFFRAMCREYEDYIPALQSRIMELEKHLENSVSKFELDTCRSLNEALRQREDKMRKSMRNAGFVWSDDEFREIEK